MLPVAAKLPVAGLYNSAVGVAKPFPPPDRPPAISTVPLISRVAVAAARAFTRPPVGANVPVVGLYNSAVDRMSLASIP